MFISGEKIKVTFLGEKFVQDILLDTQERERVYGIYCMVLAPAIMGSGEGMREQGAASPHLHFSLHIAVQWQLDFFPSLGCGTVTWWALSAGLITVCIWEECREGMEWMLAGEGGLKWRIPAEEMPVWPYHWDQSRASSLANVSLVIWQGAADMQPKIRHTQRQLCHSILSCGSPPL